ncbi:MAG: cobalamin-dependent protein [Desulfobacteraceae bacterium]|jgi:methylmalonyl-CoA mutase C-terminal domain/subunit
MDQIEPKNKRRILLGKVGFDGHDRGVKIVAAVLREAGYEVIYLGKYLTVESVVNTAIDEDVDVIGLSFLGGSHLIHSREIVDRMKANGLDDILYMVGGVIPHKGIAALKELGVDAVFPANTMTQEIVEFLDQEIGKRVK